MLTRRVPNPTKLHAGATQPSRALRTFYSAGSTYGGPRAGVRFGTSLGSPMPRRYSPFGDHEARHPSLRDSWRLGRGAKALCVAARRQDWRVRRANFLFNSASGGRCPACDGAKSHWFTSCRFCRRREPVRDLRWASLRAFGTRRKVQREVHRRRASHVGARGDGALLGLSEARRVEHALGRRGAEAQARVRAHRDSAIQDHRMVSERGGGSEDECNGAERPRKYVASLKEHPIQHPADSIVAGTMVLIGGGAPRRHARRPKC
jgi:hypothetical protein